MSGQRPWYNINSREASVQGKKGGKGFALPPAVRRENAMKSTEGGVARCHDCHITFTVTYMAVCSMGLLKESDWVCADCRKQNNRVRA